MNTKISFNLNLCPEGINDALDIRFDQNTCECGHHDETKQLPVAQLLFDAIQKQRNNCINKTLWTISPSWESICFTPEGSRSLVARFRACGCSRAVERRCQRSCRS